MPESPPQWERVRRVFHDALRRDLAARDEFLEEACGADEDLSAEVRSLLDAYERVASPPSEPSFESDGRRVPSTELPDRLGPYLILELIGSGGMGEVYLAKDTRLARNVAIKILPMELARDAERVARFDREARLLAAMNHPNIATLHEIGEADGLKYLVLELVEGETLSARLRRGPLKYREALEIAGQVAAALEAAHDKGIIHRDLKPANIKLTAAGTVKVLDFGVAKMTDPETEPVDLSEVSTASFETSRTGMVIGTVSYMSPEQARGAEVDASTDVWAFGCVLYQMLSGHKAFGGETIADTLAAILDREPDWGRLPAKTPPGGRALLARCLEKDSKRRYDSGKALSDAIELLSYDTSGQVSPHMGRSRWAPWLAVAAVLALIIGFLAVRGYWPPADAGGGMPMVESTAFVTWPSHERHARISPDGRWVAFVSDYRTGHESIWVKALDGGEPRQLIAGVAVTTNPVWSPDSARIAYVTGREGQWLLQVVSLNGGPVETSEVLPFVNFKLVRWIDRSVYVLESPVYLLERSTSMLWRFDVVERDFERLLSAAPEYPFANDHVDVAPNGRKITYSMRTGDQQDVWIADIDGRNPERLTTNSAHDYMPQWRGEEEIVFLSTRGGRPGLWRFPLRTRTASQVPSSPGDVRGIAALAAGNSLILQVLDEFADVYKLDPATGSEQVLAHDSRAEFWPTVSDDGSIIAFERVRSDGFDFADAEIVVGELRATGIGSERVVVADGYSPRISPNGRWVAYLLTGSELSTELSVFDMQTQRTDRVTRRFKRSSRDPLPSDWLDINFAWAPDRSTLFFVTDGEDDSSDEVREVSMPIQVDTEPRLIVRGEPRSQLRDLIISADASRLAYAVGPWGDSEIRVRSLADGVESVAFSDSGAGAIQLKGWLPDGSLVVLRTIGVGFSAGRVEVLKLDASGEVTRLGEISGAIMHNARLEPTTATVYLIQDEAGIHNLAAYSLYERSLRRLTSNLQPQTSFAGLEIAASGELLFSKHSRSLDLWHVRLGTGDPVPER
jgi:Tol biopolymer transport system component/tRNA A-37 threonylcarbamoyl transferase component Bud32